MGEEFVVPLSVLREIWKSARAQERHNYEVPYARLYLEWYVWICYAEFLEEALAKTREENEKLRRMPVQVRATVESPPFTIDLDVKRGTGRVTINLPISPNNRQLF